MTGTATEKDAAALLVDRIEALGNGELAELRRGCGARIADRPRLLWFAGLVRGSLNEEAAFLSATLLAQYSTLTIRAGRHRGEGDFGQTWRRAIGPNPSDSLRRRFLLLLDCALQPDGSGDLPFRLRQMVRFAASKEVGIDWPQLMRDLRNWSHPEKFVQKRWARSFYGDGPSTADSP